MVSLLRTLLGVFVSYVFFAFSENVLGISSWWIALLISIATAAGVVFIKRKKGTRKKTTRQERVINLTNGSAGPIFVRSKYSNFKLVSSDATGNSYMSPDGVLICTKYFRENLTIRSDKISISNYTHFIISVLLIFLLWCASVDIGLMFDLSKNIGVLLCFSAMATNIVLCFMTKNSYAREQCSTLSVQFRLFGFVFIVFPLLVTEIDPSVWYISMVSMLWYIALGWIVTLGLSLVSSFWNEEKKLNIHNAVCAAIYYALSTMLFQ